LLLSVLAVGGAVLGVLGFSGELHAFASGWMPLLEADAWWKWLFVGPLKLLFWLVGWVLFLGLAGALLVGALLLASLLASPFLEALSRRVEALVTGRVEEIGDGGWLAPLREGGRSMLEEARRLAFFVGVQLGLLGFGLLVPGGQVVAPPAMTLVAVLFLPLDYASYALDRRRLSFRDKRRWVVERGPLMLGYGAAAFLTCLVPGLNLLAMPVLVIGGTLLVLRHPPAVAPA
ncbi:MAG: EI24 domain-containing protein, partial [Myxococcota bacterium]